MTKLYVVIGTTKDPTRVWPVMWSIDPEGAHRVKDACTEQAKAFVDELSPIWTQMEDLRMPHPYSWRGGRKNKNYDAEMRIYQQERHKLEDLEHAINAKYRDSMIDALFPTGNDGWCPEVEYLVWTLYESIREELDAKMLMLMRAKLHANEEADSFPGEDP